MIGALHSDYRPPVRHLPRPRADRLVRTGVPQVAFQQARRLRELWIARAREDFGAFLEYAFRDDLGHPIEVQWYQEDWSRVLEQHRLVLIVAPRNHGKSTFMVARIVWELGRNPNLRIKLACEDQGLAVKRLEAVRRHIDRNPRVREVFPDLRPGEGDTWAKTQLTVARQIIDKEPSIEAAGVLQGVTGGRADLILGDDVVGERNALTIPALRERVKDAWDNDWMNVAGPDTRVWVICTLWHRDDLNHRLMASNEWTTVFHAVGTDFGALWPQRWPEEQLRAKRRVIGGPAFARGYRNQCRDEEAALVRDGWLVYRSAADMPPPSELIFFTSYDPAKEPKPGADFTAEVVAAIHPPSSRVFIVSARHGHITRARQSAWVWAGWQRFHPHWILIEDIGHDLAAWVLRDHPDLQGIVRTVKPRLSKYHRLESVAPMIERGQVEFLDQLNPAHPAFNPARGDLISELLDFPLAKHDDLVDALSQVLSAARYHLLDRRSTGGATIKARVTDASAPIGDGMERLLQ